VVIDDVPGAVRAAVTDTQKALRRKAWLINGAASRYVRMDGESVLLTAWDAAQLRALVSIFGTELIDHGVALRSLRFAAPTSGADGQLQQRVGVTPPAAARGTGLPRTRVERAASAAREESVAVSDRDAFAAASTSELRARETQRGPDSVLASLRAAVGDT
jgi:hypothetical protein